MTDQLRWEEFDQMHVIKRLKQLVGKWWQVQINFTDKTGFLRNVPEGRFFNPLNPVCKEIVASQRGFSDCVKDARKTTVDAMSLKSPKVFRTTSGFSAIAVPIKMGREYMGCVYADGFVLTETADRQRALIQNYIERILPDKSEKLSKKVKSLPSLTEKDVEYLSELIKLVVDEIIQLHSSLNKQKREINKLSGELGNRYNFDQMIGKSAAMQELYQLLERVCDSDSTVLVQGENGTGKELIAKALHYNSSRKNNNFLIVNCGAFNENLLESELFGHVKGAFTGASTDKKGLFEAANKGTLFLDEIGETSMTMQVKLLRVLQEGTFTPVGSTKQAQSNVRVLAATNRNLIEMVKQGTFREDLFYRLNVINIVVPPLRNRKEDIPILTDHFLKKYQEGRNSKDVKKLEKTCLERMLDHDWPGNVRELENEIERLCVLSGKDESLGVELLSPRIRESRKTQYPGLRVNGRLKDAVAQLEKQMIHEGLERCNWNKSQLAKELGMSRANLISKVKQYELEKRRAV